MLLSSEEVFYVRNAVMKKALNLSKHHWDHNLKFLIPQMTSQQIHWLGTAKEELPRKLQNCFCSGNWKEFYFNNIIIAGGTLYIQIYIEENK